MGYKCQMGPKLRTDYGGDLGRGFLCGPPRPGMRRFIVIVTLLATTAALSGNAEAKSPPALRGPIATVGDSERSVEAIDIQQAALSLGLVPPKGMTTRAWRRTLLDRCVDRELLALEAERRGLPDDPEVVQGIEAREFSILIGELHQRVLVPAIKPGRAEFDSIKAAGRYRSRRCTAGIRPPPRPVDTSGPCS